MKDNMGKLVWDWLGDARQRIECHSINIHWGYFSGKSMIKTESTERVNIIKASSMP